MDNADAAELSIEAARESAVRKPTGHAPCTCAIVCDDDGQHVTACELADAEHRERPAGCTRRRA